MLNSFKPWAHDLHQININMYDKIKNKGRRILWAFVCTWLLSGFEGSIGLMWMRLFSKLSYGFWYIAEHKVNVWPWARVISLKTKPPVLWSIGNNSPAYSLINPGYYMIFCHSRSQSISRLIRWNSSIFWPNHLQKVTPHNSNLPSWYHNVEDEKIWVVWHNCTVCTTWLKKK